MYRRWKDQVDFYVVYIKEIHPSDGWQVDENLADGVVFTQPTSIDQRIDAGQACMLQTALEPPALVDGMDNAVSNAWNAIPERLALVGLDGSVVYKSGPGPMFFLPAEWEEAISSYSREQAVAS
ncbi:MAG: hypothetical protein H8E45_08370 [Proteobacteria bacterium]|nr:hypothetical protein [Pseudomonadota bacterium]